jgi:uncharacterized protein YjbI with pentapeptide repeats
MESAMGEIISSLQGVLNKQSKLFIGLFVGLAIAGVGSLAVSAAVPDSKGAVYICYRTGGMMPNGAARIIDKAASSCSSNETEIAVNKATIGNFIDNLAGGDFTGMDLGFRNFSGADLHNGKFDNSVLTSGDYIGSNLSGASFVNTKIDNANFNGANLSASKFNDTDIATDSISARNTNFTNADLSISRFKHQIDFTGTSFASTNLSGSNWDNAHVIGGDFRQANLMGVNLGSDPANSSSFTNSNFSGKNFSGINISETRFESGSDLSNTDFSALFTQGATPNTLRILSNGANFSGANFSYPGGRLDLHFTNTNATGANFANLTFDVSDLIGSDLSGANVTNTTWIDTLCPDGTDSDDNGNTCIGHLVP